MKNNYEVMFIYEDKEEIFTSSKQTVQEIFSEYKVKVVKEKDLGVKKFAYEINKKQQGRYYLYLIEVDGLEINKLNKELRLKEDIIRFMFIRLDEKGLKSWQ